MTADVNSSRLKQRQIRGKATESQNAKALAYASAVKSKPVLGFVYPSQPAEYAIAGEGLPHVPT